MVDETTPGDELPAEKSVYDQEFFLDLAAKGKDVWNAWRRDPANKHARVTFAGVDFSESPWEKINFSGFEFGDNADFSACKRWGIRREEDSEVAEPIRVRFTGATFGWGADFNGASLIVADFTRADFGDSANFTGAKFGTATFTRATFGDAVKFTSTVFVSANFTDAVFGIGAIFACAEFGTATFTRATFGMLADFGGAAFGSADFSGVTFGIGSFFNCATFGDDATFIGAAFDDTVDFTGVTFGPADFNRAHFKGPVDFGAMSENQWTEIFPQRWFSHVTARNAPEALTARQGRHKESWKRHRSGPDRFLSISFSGAGFYGEAYFSGRLFEQTANFAGARFYAVPVFDGATNFGRIDFTGAQIGFAAPGVLLSWTEDSRIPVRLRALRKFAEDTKNHDLERDLYIEERKAERGVYLRQLLDELKSAPEELKKKLEDIDGQRREVWSNWRHRKRARNAHRLEVAVKIARLAVHSLWIGVMGVYWALADYGRSFVRPAAWLVASGFFFYWCYTRIFAPLVPKAGPLADHYDHAIRMLALGNTVPFVGPLTIDSEIKKFLFCPGFSPCLPIPPEGYQLLVLSQNLLSIICVFFIGLALRNYFRIK